MQDYRVLIKSNDTVRDIVLTAENPPAVGTVGELLGEEWKILEVLDEN
jgi:hypothetical protein